MLAMSCHGGGSPRDVESEREPRTDPVGDLCLDDQEGFGTRPLWSEIGEVPDYRNVADNFTVDDSMRLLASTMNKAISRLESLRTKLDEASANGDCACGGEPSGGRPTVVLMGYWPPTNEMLRPWSTEPDKNPGDWVGENWEGLGYDVRAFFPEFPPDGDPSNDPFGSEGWVGTPDHDLQVDYQETSKDFWRIVDRFKPEIIITTSRGNPGKSWEVEAVEGGHGIGTGSPSEDWSSDEHGAVHLPTEETIDQRSWDAISTYRNGNHLNSALPMDAIVTAASALALPGVEVYIDQDGTSANYLSGFLGLHGIYYQQQHGKLAGGHIHVGIDTGNDDAHELMKATLRATLEAHPPATTPTTGGNLCEKLLVPQAPRNECVAACVELAAAQVCGATGLSSGWSMDDLYRTATNVALKALVQIEFLDRVVGFITSDEFGAKLEAAGALSTKISNASDFLDDAFVTINQFTEGFHLGAYSEERPDLWYCVPRAGSGVFAKMGNLGGGRFSIGSSYTSGLAAKKIKGLFSLAGATLEAGGRNYPFMPSVAYGVQIDGFRMFDEDTLFGIDIGGGGLPVAGLENLDIFHLMPQDGLSDLDGDDDGKVGWLELLRKSFFEVDYTSGADDQEYSWPRDGIDDSAAEQTSIAQFGAGLDLKLEMEQKTWDGKPIPIAGFASVKPFFTLDAGVAWHHEHNRMLDRIRAALGIEQSLTERDMHAMQAPDASRDVGVSAHVDPRVGATLTIGKDLSLKKWLKLKVGVFASIALKLGIKPGVFGDTIDTSRGLATFLDGINPAADLPCTPILHTPEPTASCFNMFASPAAQVEIAALDCTSDNTKCTSGGVCIPGTLDFDADGDDGGQAIPGGEQDCIESGGIWQANVCGLASPGSEIIGWTGPGCSPLSENGGGYIGLDADAQAMLDAALADDDAPRHSIFTYALADLTFEAVLDASILAQLSMTIKLFGKQRSKTWTIFKWADAWDLGSTNKTWLQKGLEAEYQNDCAAPGPVTNHQPSKVRRYPSAGRPGWSSLDDSDELVDNWCYPSVEGDITYEAIDVPTEDALVDGIAGYTEMGADVGESMWEESQLCVDGELSWVWAAEHLSEQSCSVLAAVPGTKLACTNQFTPNVPAYDCAADGEQCATYGSCLCEGPPCEGFGHGTNWLHDVTEAECDGAGEIVTWVPNACTEVSDDATLEVLTTGSCEHLDTLVAIASGCLVTNDPSVPSSPSAWTSDGYVDLALITDDDGELRAPYDTAAWNTWASAFADCIDATSLDAFEVELACALDGSCAPESCCGDGVLSEHEPCDLSAPGSPTSCTEHCSLVVCGDGRKQGSEQCDDGNTTKGDGCSNKCMVERVTAPSDPAPSGTSSED